MSVDTWWVLFGISIISLFARKGASAVVPNVCYINTCLLVVSSTPQNSSSPSFSKFLFDFQRKKRRSEFRFPSLGLRFLAQFGFGLWKVSGFFGFSGFLEMEVSLVRSSQVKIGRADLGHREIGFFKLTGISKKTNISFGQSTSWKNGRLQFTLRAVQSESVRPVKASGPSKRSKPVRLLLLLYLCLVCQKLKELGTCK